MNLDEEERRDKDAVELSLKKYQRGIKFLFTKYAYSTGKNVAGASFNQYQKIFEVISLADLLKMCREVDLVGYITKEELSNLVKKLNMRFGDKSEFNSLDFEGFNMLIVNLAFLCFSKEPKDLRSKGISFMIDELFKFVAESQRKKGQSGAIFDEFGAENMIPGISDPVQMK